MGTRNCCGHILAANCGQPTSVKRLRSAAGSIDIATRAACCSSICAIGTARPRSFSRPKAEAENLEQAKALRSEFVIQVVGQVAKRPEGTINPKLGTGEIEVRVEKLTILNKSLTPPFQPTSMDLPGEDIRLKYRYVDLRRPEMQRTMLLRNRMIKLMRDYFDAHGFIDVETPILGRSTPEGARDYLVPSRVQQGMFYALPQSPQLYKQILMIAGYDRYIQVARCFRDEDLRADRQPEFTQLDLEMSFITAEDIIGEIDGLVARMAKEILGLDVPLPLKRMTYDEAMERFGHDAPDLRFGMELTDLTDIAKESEFKIFRAAADSGGRVRCINAKGAADRYSRKNIDELTAFIKEDFGAQGLFWFKVDADGKLASPIAKNFSAELLEKIGERMDAAPGDFLLDRGRQIRSHLQGALCPAKTAGRGIETLRSEADALLLDRRVSDVRLRRRGKMLGGHASSVHFAAAARPRNAGHRSRQVPRRGLRPGDQRLRGRRRNDSYPRPGIAAASVRSVGHQPRTSPGALRLPLGRPAIRRAAARRHRAGHRPPGDALRRIWTTSATASPSPRPNAPPT